MLKKSLILPITIALKHCLYAVVLIHVCWGQALGASLNHGDAVLVQFPAAEISRSEFEISYQAWRDDFPKTRMSSEDFLKLLIRLKQFALIAREMGLHREPEFHAGLKRFIGHAQTDGLLRRDIENRKLREAYDRRQYLLHASQLLVSRSTDAEGQPVSALNKIMRLRESLLTQGTSFDAVARRVSDDPSVQENAGSLGYITVFEQIYPLETAAYETPIGEISAPVESRFGYHLVKVNSRQRIRGLKRAEHILIRHDSGDARTAIERIHLQLGPDNFAELATMHSQDYKTSVKGGDLGTDRLVDPLESVKLALPAGSISAPFKSTLGWHILRVTAVEVFPSFVKSRPLLREKLKLDDRVQREIESIIAATDLLALDSATLDSYVDDRLCQALVAQSGTAFTGQQASRNQLIKQLMQRPPGLSLERMPPRFAAKIDSALLRLVKREMSL